MDIPFRRYWRTRGARIFRFCTRQGALSTLFSRATCDLAHTFAAVAHDDNCLQRRTHRPGTQKAALDMPFSLACCSFLRTENSSSESKRKYSGSRVRKLDPKAVGSAFA